MSTFFAVVTTPVCPLMTQPKPDCELADEALFGMILEVLEETSEHFWRVRTPYRYEGFAPKKCLETSETAVKRWGNTPKKVVLHKNTVDVMHEPKVQSWPIVTLPMGAVVGVEESPSEGWQKVLLPGNQEGFVRESWLDTFYEAPVDLPEKVLRRRLVDTAMLYRRTHYRWGGKTPNGIDCSGLVSMAYLLNGITIYRDAHIKPEFDLVEIPKEDMDVGDLLFFPGHVAMYMGEGKYLHSTGKAGSDGFDINSLDPADPLYRRDLAEGITQVGSYRGFHRE